MTPNTTPATRGTIVEGDTVRVEGRYSWDPDSWMGEVKSVCLPTDPTKEAYAIITHPKAHIGMVTRTVTELRESNDWGRTDTAEKQAA